MLNVTGLISRIFRIFDILWLASSTRLSGYCYIGICWRHVTVVMLCIGVDARWISLRNGNMLILYIKLKFPLREHLMDVLKSSPFSRWNIFAKQKCVETTRLRYCWNKICTHVRVVIININIRNMQTGGGRMQTHLYIYACMRYCWLMRIEE